MFRVFKLTVMLPALLLIPAPGWAQMNWAKTNLALLDSKTTNDEGEGKVGRLIVPSFALPAKTVGPPSRSTVFQTSQPRDSLKNGAIIGAVSGALAGAFLALFVCKLGEELEGETPDDFRCAGPAVFLVGTGTVLGAAIGVGVDALFERGPSAALPAGGRRAVLRLRFGF